MGQMWGKSILNRALSYHYEKCERFLDLRSSELEVVLGLVQVLYVANH